MGHSYKVDRIQSMVLRYKIQCACIQCGIYILMEVLGALTGQVSPLWKRTWIQSPLILEGYKLARDNEKKET